MATKKTRELNTRPDMRAARGNTKGVDILNNQKTIDNNFKSKRTEMKGPSYISDILSRMKSKKVDVNNKRNSKVSVKDLKQMSNIKVPKSSKKRSSRNTISLEL